MLHDTIHNDDFQYNAALQLHCYNIISNGGNIVAAFQRCVELKIIAANRPVQHHLKTKELLLTISKISLWLAVPIYQALHTTCNKAKLQSLHMVLYWT